MLTIVGNLKSFFAHMYRQKKHKNLFYKHEIFNLSREEADTVSLSEAEVKHLYQMDLSPSRGGLVMYLYLLVG